MKNIFILTALMFSSLFANGNEVNIYSHRHYQVDTQLYKEFEKETGIKVNIIKASSAELIQRIIQEGKYTKADLLLTTDVGMLELAKSKGIFTAIDSKILDQTVPKYLRDEDKMWFALTKRARVIAYNIDEVDKKELSTYEALTDKKWKYKIVITKSNEVYNQSLLASIIVNDGKEQAKEWAKGIKANMARRPTGVDKDSLRAIAAGLGDVAIVNTYYIGQMIMGKSLSDQATSEYIGVFFPNQEGRGTHINVSGAGIVKYSKHKENALKLLEFLVSKKAQEIFANVNFEYPVNKEAKMSKLLESWGEFKEDKTSLSKVGSKNIEAVKIFDDIGWNK